MSHVFTGKLCNTSTEDGKCKTCYVLVCPEGNGDEGEEKTCDGTDGKGGEDSTYYGHKTIGCTYSHSCLIGIGSCKAEGSTHIHDSFNSKVEASRLLCENLTESSEHQNSSEAASCSKKSY